MEKSDLRYEKNEAAILDAFLELLLEENFSEIKVSQICQRAKINRSTFYLHYDNKEIARRSNIWRDTGGHCWRF